MDSIAKQHYFRDKACQELANARSIEALLNCYSREVAAPAHQLRVEPLAGGDWPQAFFQRAALAAKSGAVLHLPLPELEDRLAILVRRDSPSLNFHYATGPFHKRRGQGWRPLDHRSLAALLLELMARRHAAPFNVELYRQILNSAGMMELFVANAPHRDWGEGARAYIASEQALSFGHVFHPTPKSREGFSADDLPRYSPELGAAFPLAYFAVRDADLVQDSLWPQASPAWIATLAPPELRVPSGHVAVPVHPWQAQFLSRQPVVRRALAAGRLRALGQAGPAWHPTASVRTLYRPGAPFFLKFSLHLRLTNCVRKNARYELESAVALSRLLRTELAGWQLLFPDTRLLPEPAFATVDFPDAAEAERTLLAEGFGFLVREGLVEFERAGHTPLLAAALFQSDVMGQSPVLRQVQRLAERSGLARGSAALTWLDAYLERVLAPVLYCYFHHGVVFEPHLQNVVIVLAGGLPQQVLLRDLEGTKLVRAQWPEARLGGMSARARQSVHYDAEQGWARVAYCLLANNLFQAVFHLGAGDSRLERRLWQLVRQHLAAYQARYGCARSLPLIGALLAGEPLPYKTNFLTRVFKRADRDSQYVRLAHPLGRF